MKLYTVHYCLQHMVSRFDTKGKKIADEVKLIEQTLTALPYAAAMQYKDLPNFSMVRYQTEARGKSSWKGVKRGELTVISSGNSKGKTYAKKAAPKSGVHHAAATGDLGAAISGVK